MSVTGWDGVTLTVEVALSAATSTYGLWDVDLWDEALWGPDIDWTDLTALVRSVRTDRGFSRGITQWSGGSATVVFDNRVGDLSPANLTGAYAIGGVTQIRPSRPIRIRATYAGVTYPIWQGYIRRWAESWTGGAPGKGDAISTVDCYDEFGRLAKVDGLEVAAVGAGELSGYRVHRVLDAAGHTGERVVAVGEVTLQATTLDKGPVAELEDVVNAEGGAAWVEADGSLQFADQHALTDETRSASSQATFTDDGTANSYAAAAVDYSDDLIVNWAVYTADGGTPQAVDDPTSRALYGDARDTKTLICETDAQALTLAEWAVQQYKDPEDRFSALTVLPRRDPTALWPQVLGRKVRDQITVTRHPPGGFAITRHCHIAGASHDIAPGGKWTVSWPLWSAEPYVLFANSRWDLGRWDEAVWSY